LKNTYVFGQALNNFKIALQFPVGHAIQPLTPFPVTGGGKVVNKGVAKPVTGNV